LQSKYSFITEVRGRGLLLAMEFDRDIAQDVLMACLKNGLLINRLKPNTIRMIPPLIISNDDVDKAVTILDKVLSDFVI
jgi:acetylornithine/succinyldiaminopimelate/putrescine aminotransferase